MRLINTGTLELETFRNPQNRPPYAILSHRWIDDEEVTFQDMQRPHRKWMPGWQKIRFCCDHARAEGVSYAWVDTCCIDKDSSAELSEAINSMYSWYSNAVTCYAYLSDVHKSSSSALLEQIIEAVTRSKWFTRAWTLQELIAPSSVVFFDADFVRLGDKQGFSGAIERLTQIPTGLLLDPRQLADYPVALKMSWAADREATRTEDIAYSLFGLFEVNLPLLYGEGPRAFIRLQEEIIRNNHDHTIFLWHSRPFDSKTQSHRMKELPILAPSPDKFKTCQDVVKLEGENGTKAYAMTNVGLEIELPLHPYRLDIYVALLDCGHKSHVGRYGILLTRDRKNKSKWHRICVDGLDVVTISASDVEKNSLWQRINVMRGNLKVDSGPNNAVSETRMNNQQSDMLYGIKINAASFLKWSVNHIRSYALVAYHDWAIEARSVSIGQNEKQNQPESRLSGDSLLSPSSFKHISHFHTATVPIDKMLHVGLSSSPSSVDKGRLETATDAPRPTQSSEDQDHQIPLSRALTTKQIGMLEMPVLTSGLCGIIVFDHLVHGLYAVKIGFDFDFRPVVFLATHEATKDTPIENWVRQWRFKHVDAFEHSPYIQRDLHHEDVLLFWRLQPDIMRSRKPQNIVHTDAIDAPIKLREGVYGLRSTSSTNIDHWTFKPREDESWHIALKLEKHEVDKTIFWELTMDREDEAFEFNVELSQGD